MGGPGSGPKAGQRKGFDKKGFPQTKTALLREKLAALKNLQKKTTSLRKKAEKWRK
jgi:hypothetical protein